VPLAKRTNEQIASHRFLLLSASRPNRGRPLVRNERRIGIKRDQIFGLLQMCRTLGIIARGRCAQSPEQRRQRDFQLPRAAAPIHLRKGASKHLADMVCDVVAQLQSKCTAKSIRAIGLDETPDMRMPALEVADHVDEPAEEAAGRRPCRCFGKFGLQRRFEIWINFHPRRLNNAGAERYTRPKSRCWPITKFCRNAKFGGHRVKADMAGPPGHLTMIAGIMTAGIAEANVACDIGVSGE
jgi:hypothetical protein